MTMREPAQPVDFENRVDREALHRAMTDAAETVGIHIDQIGAFANATATEYEAEMNAPHRRRSNDLLNAYAIGYFHARAQGVGQWELAAAERGWRLLGREATAYQTGLDVGFADFETYDAATADGPLTAPTAVGGEPGDPVWSPEAAQEIADDPTVVARE